MGYKFLFIYQNILILHILRLNNYDLLNLNNSIYYYHHIHYLKNIIRQYYYYLNLNLINLQFLIKFQTMHYFIANVI